MNVTRRPAVPQTYIDSEGMNIGDERIFPDGHPRILGYSRSGVRRWLSAKETQDAETPLNNVNQIDTKIKDAEDVANLNKINIEEWIEFNKYLTEENPFLSCLNFEELNNQWFTQCYGIQSKKEIGVFSNKQIEKQFEDIDNYYLAFLMFKMCAVISEIKLFEPQFNYKKFIKGKTWNDLYNYLEQIKEPSNIDYSSLYD